MNTNDSYASCVDAAITAGTFHAVAYAQLRRAWSDRGVQPPDLWLWAPLALGLLCYLVAFLRFRAELRLR